MQNLSGMQIPALPGFLTPEPLTGQFESLQIGGMVPLSAGDYPDCLSAVVFCQGCPWRCRYCHNSHLQMRRTTEKTSRDLFSFLSGRVGLLDAVVFSGGEPTYQPGITATVRAVRQLGFKIGLHTAAPQLETLRQLLPYLDWVGLDIKALPEDYAEVTGIAGSGKSPFQALALLQDAGIEFEVRTTAHPLLLDEEKLSKLAGLVAEAGVKTYALQVFRQNGCIDVELNSAPAAFSRELVGEIAGKFERFILRDSQ
jgi:pyruvate formate lyase activating enzyme